VLKIVSCISHRNKLDRQAEPAVGLSHADGLVERNPIVVFAVDKQKFFRGTEKEKPELYRKASPIFYVSKDDPPLNNLDCVLRERHSEIRYSVVRRCGLHSARDVLPTPIPFQSYALIRGCDQFSKMSSRGRSSHAYSVRIDAVLGCAGTQEANGTLAILDSSRKR
jgi:hypothetical protein